MLHGKGLLRHTTAPVSAGLLTDLEGYVQALTSFRHGDARPIVEQFAHAARYAAGTGSRLVEDLAAVMAQSRERMAGLRPHATAWRVLPLLIAQPIVDSGYLRQRLEVSAMTAQRALYQLSGTGVLQEDHRALAQPGVAAQGRPGGAGRVRRHRAQVRMSGALVAAAMR